MAQTVNKKTGASKLGVLLQEHLEAVTLGREMIRLSICARVAGRIEEVRAAEHAAEDYFATAAQLEEQLKAQL